MAAEKKIWLVTGASRGLGFETIKAELEAGHKIVAGVRNPPDLQEKLKHPNLAVIHLNLGEHEATNIVDRAISQFGRIDVLINNVGQGLTGAIEEVSYRERLDLYKTNVIAPLSLISAILPSFREQGSGHIINITSVGAFSAGPGSGPYCGTKAALARESEALYKELKPFGITVTVVAPGGFRTEFAGSASMQHSKNEVAIYGIHQNKFSGSGKEPSDPKKFGPVIVKLVEMPDPPFELPVGVDSVEVMINTAAARLEAANANRALSLSTAIDMLREQGDRMPSIDPIEKLNA